MKGILRHFSLIPPGGGGMLSHSLAQVASWLKVCFISLRFSTVNQIMKDIFMILRILILSSG